MGRQMWIVYNEGEDLEFAECSSCGYEQEPSQAIYYDENQKEKDRETFYSAKCPRCGAETMGKWIRAEDVE